MYFCVIEDFVVTLTLAAVFQKKNKEKIIISSGSVKTHLF